MARTNSLPNFLTDVADAIKEKKGSQADIPAANFDTEIRNLPGGSYQSKTVTITQNQSQTIIDPDTNYDAMLDVTVNVSVPEKQLQTKNYTFTQNTITTLQPEQGYDGFDQVGIEINVQGGSQDPTTATANDILSPKTAYSNGQKITGVMPDNGTLSFTSSENNQTIPAGYTSGGTIAGITIEDMSAYDPLLEQSKYLLYGGALYAELEYIIFTGTQYIDTEIIPTNHSTEAKVNFDTYNNDEHLLGTSRGYLYYHFTTYNNRYYWGNDNGESNGGSWTAGTHVIVYNGDNHAITMDGTVIGSGSNIASSQNLWIGRRDTVTNLQATLYYIKIVDKSTNELVRDLIPVKRISDNVVCLYDKISKEFFENQGTGDFIAGPEKGEPSYIELEYIQSTGTQYIDTGIKPDGNTRVVAKWTNGTNNGVVFGAYNGDWTTGYGLYQNAASSSGTYWRHYFSNDNTNRRRVTPAVLDMNKGTFILNNETIYTTATKSDTTSYSMYIFAGNWNGSRVEQKTSLSLWYFQIYDNDTLVRDFVPAKRIADNTICLYDKVSNAFFTNQGTGVFTAGPEK